MHPLDLADHDCVSFEGIMPAQSWAFREAEQDISAAIRPRLSVNTAEAAVDAAVAGLGVTRVLSYQAKRAVQDGLLVPLLEEFEQPASPVHLVHLSQGVLPLKLRVFLDFAAPRLRAVLR
jgi:DNA-binding transcriptional LysR family regulator